MSKERYLLIRAEGPPGIVEIDRKHWLDDVYAALRIECFEIVHLSCDRVLIVDESGAINGSHHNPIASLFYPAGIFGDVLLATKKKSKDGGYDIFPFSEPLTASLLLGAQEMYKQIKHERKQQK